MYTSILDILPVMISIIALIVSFMSYRNERNNVISNVVSADRIKWISSVRDLISLFLEKYINGSDPEELKVIKSKIDLYIIFDKETYKKFEEKLNHCIDNPYTYNDYRELVIETQKVLNSVWIRIKTETGIATKDERKINKILNKKQ